MKPLGTLLACGCAALALIGCGSSSDKASATPAATQAPASAQDQAASQVCSARDGIQTEVQTLSSLSAGSATKAGVTSALTAISTDLQKIRRPAEAGARAQAAGPGRHDGLRHAAEGHRPADGGRPVED